MQLIWTASTLVNNQLTKKLVEVHFTASNGHCSIHPPLPLPIAWGSRWPRPHAQTWPLQLRKQVCDSFTLESRVMSPSCILTHVCLLTSKFSQDTDGHPCHDEQRTGGGGGGRHWYPLHYSPHAGQARWVQDATLHAEGRQVPRGFPEDPGKLEPLPDGHLHHACGDPLEGDVPHLLPLLHSVLALVWTLLLAHCTR